MQFLGSESGKALVVEGGHPKRNDNSASKDARLFPVYNAK